MLIFLAPEELKDPFRSDIIQLLRAPVNTNILTSVFILFVHAYRNLPRAIWIR